MFLRFLACFGSMAISRYTVCFPHPTWAAHRSFRSLVPNKNQTATRTQANPPEKMADSFEIRRRGPASSSGHPADDFVRPLEWQDEGQIGLLFAELPARLEDDPDLWGRLLTFWRQQLLQYRMHMIKKVGSAGSEHFGGCAAFDVWIARIAHSLVCSRSPLHFRLAQRSVKFLISAAIRITSVRCSC